jgi:hypothetical protein
MWWLEHLHGYRGDYPYCWRGCRRDVVEVQSRVAHLVGITAHPTRPSAHSTSCAAWWLTGPGTTPRPPEGAGCAGRPFLAEPIPG